MMAVWNGRYERTDGTVVRGRAWPTSRPPRRSGQGRGRRPHGRDAGSTEGHQGRRRQREDGLRPDAGGGQRRSNAMLQVGIDALVAQNRAIEQVVAALDLEIQVEAWTASINRRSWISSARCGRSPDGGYWEPSPAWVPRRPCRAGRSSAVLCTTSRWSRPSGRCRCWARSAALPLWTYDPAGMPIIRVRKGDRVRATLVNGLPEHTSVHWHGLRVPNAVDGVPFVTQKPVHPGERLIYEFERPTPGRSSSIPIATRWSNSAAGSPASSSSRATPTSSRSTLTSCWWSRTSGSTGKAGSCRC